jgi:hypothetical protein
MVQFTATILLERPWAPDIEAVAAAMAERFPAIGRVEAVPARSAVRVDGAEVAFRPESGTIPENRLVPPMRPVRVWDPEPAISGHVAYLDISCGGDLPGLEGSEAYAAVVHFAAAAAAGLAPAAAVFWSQGWALSSPGTFMGSANDILAGRMPLGAWVSFASVVPRDYAAGQATGMVTYGMRPFIGRELELAPRPGDPQSAWRCIGRIARTALDRGLKLADGVRLGAAEGGWAVTVREREHWLRPGEPVFVLVSDDAIVDAQTLRPRTAPAV